MSKSRIFKFLNKEEDPMQLAELQAQIGAVEAQLSAAQTELSAALADKETAMTSLAAMVAENEKLAEALASVEGEIAGLKAEQAAAKLAARQSALSAVVAADRVEGLMANLAGLDDTAFHAVVEGFAATKTALEQSDLMTELGQDAEDQDASVTQEDAGNAATLAAIKRLARK